MPDIVIVAYRPKPGREAALAALVRGHVPFLRKLGLATERAPILMQAADGTILEVLEWKDGAVEAAHRNPEIAKLWQEYDEVCTYASLKDLSEATGPFATFRPFA